MKRLHINFCGMVLLFFVGNAGVQAQQTFKTTDKSVIGYLEYLPNGYQLNSEKYPVVIFLHGIGERGNNSTDPAVLSQSIQTVANLGPPMFVKNGVQFPFILISPQLKDNYGNWPSDYVLEVLNYVKTYLRIDEKRIYLTGLSLGGGGAWWTAQDYPELFAAIAPVCGGRASPALACNIASENLPVWAFHGDKDTVVPVLRTVNMVNAINACLPKMDPEPMLTIYQGVAHDAWNFAYRIDNSLHSPNIYEWMLSFRNTINAGNRLPTADAGSDKSIFGKNCSIIGNASDADGSISGYLWTQLSGPTVADLTNQDTQTLYATGFTEGQYVFRFRATDNGGGSDTDYIIVNVDDTNQSPVANAGADMTLLLPADLINFTGKATDSDGSITELVWSNTSGPLPSLSGVNTSTLTASGLVSGTYVFRLTVSDDRGACHFDEVSLIVQESVAPIANAGPNIIIAVPSSSVTIPGSGIDPNGHIVGYQWIMRSGPYACSLHGTTSPTLNVTDLAPGSYIFRLTVRDDSGLTDYDDVKILVTMPPVVDAGPDISVELPVESITLEGSVSDTDGIIKNFGWSKYSGPSAHLLDRYSLSLTISNLKEGTYVFVLRAIDNLYVKNLDYVTVNVTSPVLSTSSTSTTSLNNNMIIESDVQMGENNNHEVLQPILGLKTSSELENSMVAIFNPSGEQIFSGVWTLERYNQVFSQSGLYIYNIIKEGRRMEAGRIFVKL